MMRRSAWVSILAVGTWLVGLEPDLCLAQPPPSAVPAAAGNPAGAAQPPPSARPATPGGAATGPVQVPGGPTPSRSGPEEPPTTTTGRPPAVRSLQPATPAQPVESLARFPNLPEAPTEPQDFRFPINLATALRLSDARPIIVAMAQAGVWVAEAQLQRARVLWIPTLNIGFDYIRHDGGGPDFNKGIMTAPSVNFFYGGAGMWQYIGATDAIFLPLAARQTLNARHWEIQAAKNDALMSTAMAYFSVHQQRGMYTGALYCIQRGHDLVERIAQLSREFVPAVEVERARNLVADLEQQAVASRQEWRVQSANLTQVLRLDPRSVLVPIEHDHLQLTLIEPGRVLDDLIPIALTNRPELAGHQAMVQATIALLRREKMRPLIPSILINGFQTPNELLMAGIFGLGPNNSMNQWTGRFDMSLQPLWQLDAFGIGNLARIKEARGMESLAIIELFKTQDMVAADVTRAHARLQSAALRVVQADRALRTAIITFNGNYQGLQQTTRFGDVLVLVNRPQEVVFALQLMKLAFDEYFTTVADYNRAQFELFHALGYPAQELTLKQPPGPVEPVNLARPAYLPPVGNGPPPATR
jgi:outer membrane protein TolC